MEHLSEPRSPREKVLKQEDATYRWEDQPPRIQESRQGEASYKHYAEGGLRHATGRPFGVQFVEAIINGLRACISETRDSLLEIVELQTRFFPRCGARENSHGVAS